MKKLINNAKQILGRSEFLTLPSSLAYYFVLSLVPIVSFLLLIASKFNLSATFITDFISNNFSKDIVEAITPMVTNQSLSFGYIIYLLLAFYIASNGSDAIIVSSNLIFNIDNNHFVKRRLKAFCITILLFILFAFILIVPVFGSQILNLISLIGLNNNVLELLKMIYSVFNIPITLFVIYLGIKWIFVIAPDQKIESKYVIKGALFTTICWFIMTFVYSFYLKHFASYSLYYAGLSNLVILMVWFYLLAYVFVIGLCLNYKNVEKEIEKTNAIKLKEIEEKVKTIKK